MATAFAGTLTVEDVRRLPTLTVPETAAFMRRGLRQTYTAIHAGELPSLRLGGTILVPTGPLLEVLGLSD